jgi:hypothetical protein
MKFIGTANLGMLLLAIFLIVHGAAAFVTFPNIGIVTAILALAAGVLLLLGR